MGLWSWVWRRPGVLGIAELVPLVWQAAHSPARPGRVPEAYHAGVDCGLLNVPCNARDKGIPVLEVCVEVSLWELEDRNIWLLENRSKLAGCPGNKLLPTHAASSLWKAMSPSACHVAPQIPLWTTRCASRLQTGPTSASHQLAWRHPRVNAVHT